MSVQARKIKRLLLNPLAWRIRLYLWAGAVLCGLIAILLVKGSLMLDLLFIGMAEKYRYAPLIITPLGMVAVVWCIRNYFPGSQGGGVPQVVASMHTRSKAGLLSARILIGKTAMLLAALACGASVGIGGPMVHISASMMYIMSRAARYTPRNLEYTAIMAGSATAMATIFSAPLAGIVFAMEEISRRLEPRRTGLLIIVVLIASVVAFYGIGQRHYFGTLDYTPSDHYYWLAVLACGVSGGILGGLFSQTAISVTRGTLGFNGRHPYIFTAICALIIVLTSLASLTPTYGTSYHVAADIVQNPQQDHDLWFPIAKWVATQAAFLSGVPSGIFGPTIAIGAGLGADLWQLFNLAPAEILVLLAMAAYFAGVFQAPITASVLVLEISGNQSMILPVVATSYLALICSRLVCPQPLFRTMALGFLNLEAFLKTRA